MPENKAAWLVARQDVLHVGEAPFPEPEASEIVVRNHAVAVNPVDWMVPFLGRLRVFPWIKRPFILGSDLAGKVVAVGASVTEVKVGDRVLAMAVGACKQCNRAAEGPFQNYTIVLPRLATVIPDDVSYAEAAVVPLGITTAACGLFQRDLLALELPSAFRKPRDAWVIIWGGATSVGSNAIRLARPDHGLAQELRLCKITRRGLCLRLQEQGRCSRYRRGVARQGRRRRACDRSRVGAAMPRHPLALSRPEIHRELQRGCAFRHPGRGATDQPLGHPEGAFVDGAR
jgi:Alcohol dehydrogenase GroES-like domain